MRAGGLRGTFQTQATAAAGEPSRPSPGLARRRFGCRDALRVLLLANAALLLVAFLHGKFGMVRLHLALAHVVVGALFVLVLLLWLPFAIGPRPSIGVALAYWAMVLAPVVVGVAIPQIFMVEPLIGWGVAAWLLFRLLRRAYRVVGVEYRAKQFLEIPVYYAAAAFGIMTAIDPGGPFMISLAGHSVFAGSALGLAWRRSPATSGGGPYLGRTQVGAVAVAVALLATAVATWRGSTLAKRFGEQPPDPALSDVEVSMDSVQPVPAPVPGRVALLERGACDAIFCHDQECAQYAISPHRYSVNNAPFLKVRAQFASEFGADAPLFCDRCHSPGGLLLGQPTGDWATESGIGCVPCHSFAEPGAHNGLGTYRYIDSYSRPTRALAEARPYYDWLIWWTKIHHKLDFVAKGREKACFPCHRVVMPERYVGREGLTLGDMVSPWEHSEVRRQGVDCNTCHTYLRKDTPDQPHASPDHVMLGTNQALEQTRLREVQGSERLGELRRLFDTVWLPGKVITVDWYHSADPIMQTVQTSFSEQEALAFGHSPLGVDIDARRRPDGAIDVRIETTNQVRAHPVPSGPLDFNEIWLELLVQDATGHVFLHSGQLDERFQVEPSARRLGATVVDRGGEPIQGHRFWTAAGLRDQRILGVDAKTEDRFVVPGPAGSDGRLTVRARWLYRRYNQEVAEWALGPGRTVPVSVFGSAEATVVGASP